MGSLLFSPEQKAAADQPQCGNNRGVESRRTPLSERINANTGTTERRMVSVKILSLTKARKKKRVVFFYQRAGPAIAQHIVLTGLCSYFVMFNDFPGCYSKFVKYNYRKSAGNYTNSRSKGMS